MTRDTTLLRPMDRVVIVGLGLIGGSFAMGLKAHGLCHEVVGCSRSRSTLDRGLALGVIDRAEPDIQAAVAGADLVMLAAPIGATEALLKAMAPALDGNTVVTDAGSVKGNVVAAARAVFGKVPPWFVPGHPIAGSERSGVEAAKADLYVNHKVILTPTPETDPEALNLVQHTWRGMGADVLCMDVAQHDAVLAATSHLPHLLAFSLVDTLSKEDENQEIFRYAAGGFRDFTRIASSDPTMWHDIFIANRQSVLDVIGHFSRGLEVFKTAVEQEDSQAILGIMTRAKVARDHFTKMLAKRAYSKTMTEKNIVFTAHAGGAVKGSIRVPGDKSISHRSIMMGSLADGVTEVFGFLEGEDSLATLQAFRDLGVTIEGPNNGHVKIYGVGMHGLLPPHGPLYLGNSGTSMRLLAGLLSAQNFDVELTGDESLSRRPMGRVTKPLAQMGAAIESQEDGTPPLKIQGGQALKGIHYDMPMASAQVKSCILLAGLYAEGAVSVTEPAPTRDHTERMLRGFGYPVTSDGNKITLIGGGGLTATTIDVPADISSATFFMVAASITPGSDLTLEHVGINPTRIGVLNILKAMGGKIEVHNEREVGGEPVADIRVQYAPLKGIHIPEDQVPLAIDEFPALFVAAACAEGTTVLTGAEELRVKESDRIQVMADGLQALGVKADATADGIVIEGGPLGGGTVESHGDHRIAMSFAVAALRAEADITINNCANVATSFPNFVELSRKVGMKLDVAEVGESHA
ncbi:MULTISPECIES: bifunctional prephenate dehydrogenase/3-phosphoshikimate 1-carboxyvinyltransferase [unclassified Ketobacter]|uniref:bifunctional prephenate dehydrogenase/3-phosphoshikimate 1-carboxyvinyltransferase n=1 Tax=unclassified Ketobacter TaxID=2639109 RepID=UPI000F28BB62|nr:MULTISPECIES: bifunctional prephenate dehydrogenase/3-phosphoshikimate 1-carboxyvinyltransferase [unclassified Ketobacter]RLT88681.1 MAG: bifunctional prephenate dehydrogenase/3-phosphoshikimate 1-carboxyvinyltransferase [Ketobacter sp. GenoA1]RLT97718.1 MAG: bifunctional prephenate dehydrogenase/3-phosphoshikimate 1-carboxyvinyltransferase [Ketobacter sp.]